MRCMAKIESVFSFSCPICFSLLIKWNNLFGDKISFLTQYISINYTHSICCVEKSTYVVRSRQRPNEWHYFIHKLLISKHRRKRSIVTIFHQIMSEFFLVRVRVWRLFCTFQFQYFEWLLPKTIYNVNERRWNGGWNNNFNFNGNTAGMLNQTKGKQKNHRWR